MGKTFVVVKAYRTVKTLAVENFGELQLFAKFLCQFSQFP